MRPQLLANRYVVYDYDGHRIGLSDLISEQESWVLLHVRLPLTPPPPPLPSTLSSPLSSHFGPAACAFT